MNTRSNEAALKSIERIAHPGTATLEAKQKILFHLGTQSFANAQFQEAIGYFNQSVALGQSAKQGGCYLLERRSLLSSEPDAGSSK